MGDGPGRVAPQRDRVGPPAPRACAQGTRGAIPALLATILVCATGPGALYAQEAPPAAHAVTLESLLAEMVDRDALARWPEPAYRSVQFSSYDRRAVAPDRPGWFANRDRGEYLRIEERNGRTEYVLMDAAGPGAVVRLWSANPGLAGTLRVYLDGAREPALAMPMSALLGGEGPAGAPLAAVRGRGYNLYLPIPFARHALLTIDESPGRGIYYHVGARLYPAGTRVESLSADVLERARPALRRVQRALRNPRASPGDTAISARRVLGPADSMAVPLPRGPAAVRSLAVRLGAEGLEHALRAVEIEIDFDGARTVSAPVGDFFGSGLGLNPYVDWWRTVEAEGTMTARWVMPYRDAATVTLRNRGDHPVPIHVRAEVGDWRWDDRSLHFHTAWHRQPDLPAWPRSDWNVVTLAGRGVYVGDALAVHNPVDAWWGEGDEKIRVDDEPFPSHFGTGTEDYYGYAWCSNEVFDAPFHAQPRNDAARFTERMCRHSRGHVTNTRVRSLDAIPFRDSLRFDLEVWHWDREARLDYAATTQWYARPGGRHAVRSAPSAVAAEHPAYLMAYFRSGPGRSDRSEKLHVAYSRDGLRWYELNRNRPVWAPSDGLLRDPFLRRGPDGAFHLVFTRAYRGASIGYVRSPDLVEFEDERVLNVMGDHPDVVNAWAPEWVWDEEAGEYLLVWASSLGTGGRVDANRHYFATTPDWKTLSPARLLFDPGAQAIDAHLVRHGEGWRLFFKDEQGVYDQTKAPAAIRSAAAPRLRGPYGDYTGPLTPPYTEAPSVLQRAGEDAWYLYYDYWKDGRYGVIHSADLERWSAELDSAAVRFPHQARHATFLPITEAELWRLLDTHALEARMNPAHATTTLWSGPGDAGFLHDPFTTRSISLWFRPDETAVEQVLLDEGGAGSGVALRVRGGRLEAVARHGGEMVTTSAALPADPGWRHAVTVFEEGTLRLYLDAFAVDSAVAPFSSVGAHGDPGAVGGRVGTDAFGGQGRGARFMGALDDVRVYTVPLRPEDVAALYARRGAVSASGPAGAPR